MRKPIRIMIIGRLAILGIFATAWGFAQQNTAATTEQTLSLLSSGRGASLIDKPIILSRIRVEKVPKSIDVAPKNLGPHHVAGFWIGSTGQERVFVSVPSGLVPVDTNNLTARIQKGKIVTITGTVHGAPDEVQLKAVYHLSEQGIDTVKREGVIVEAGSIVVHKK